MTFAQIIVLGGGGDGKIHAANLDELRPHLEAWREREKPENALREAEAALAAFQSRRRQA